MVFTKSIPDYQYFSDWSNNCFDACIFLSGEHENEAKKMNEKKESGSFADQMVSWGNDLLYLLKNKSYMLSTAAFTCLTFCTGALSWFGPELVENALKVRQEHQLDGFENDIKVEE
jgi:hypothetical protein